jgi:Tfp pilus assembly protein PilF
MNRWLSQTALALGLVGTGCHVFERPQPAHYETVKPDPQHDTKLAEEEHKKSLKLFDSACSIPCRNWSKAEGHLQKALIADVAYGPAHNTLGMLYLAQRKLYLAAWEFEYAAKLMPERHEPIYNLGLLYESADKLAEAIEHYSRAFSMEPRNPDVLGSLVRARLRNGETVADLRPLLDELLFYESRTDWVAWASDQIALAKPPHVGPSIPDPGAPTETVPPPPANPPQPRSARRHAPLIPLPTEDSNAVSKVGRSDQGGRPESLPGTPMPMIIDPATTGRSGNSNPTGVPGSTTSGVLHALSESDDDSAPMRSNDPAPNASLGKALLRSDNGGMAR